VVEDRPIMSVNIVSQFQSSTFGQNWRTLHRGLSAIAELLVIVTSVPILVKVNQEIRPRECVQGSQLSWNSW